jgi:hypothetical protein
MDEQLYRPDEFEVVSAVQFLHNAHWHLLLHSSNKRDSGLLRGPLELSNLQQLRKAGVRNCDCVLFGLVCSFHSCHVLRLGKDAALTYKHNRQTPAKQ